MGLRLLRVNNVSRPPEDNLWRQASYLLPILS
jgi:hypothetical protein